MTGCGGGHQALSRMGSQMARRKITCLGSYTLEFQGIILISEVFFPYQNRSHVTDENLAAEFDRQSFVIVTEPHGGGFHLVIPKEVSSGANLLQFQIHPEAL